MRGCQDARIPGSLCLSVWLPGVQSDFQCKRQSFVLLTFVRRQTTSSQHPPRRRRRQQFAINISAACKSLLGIAQESTPTKELRKAGGAASGRTRTRGVAVQQKELAVCPRINHQGCLQVALETKTKIRLVICEINLMSVATTSKSNLRLDSSYI